MAIAKNQRVAAVGYNSTAPGGQGRWHVHLGNEYTTGDGTGVGTGYNGEPSRKPAGGGGKGGKEGKEDQEGTANDTYGSVGGPPRLFGDTTPSVEDGGLYGGRPLFCDSELDVQLGRGRVLGGFSIFDVEHTPNAAHKAASKTATSSAAPTTYHSAFDEAQPFTAPVYAVAFNPVQPVLYTAGGRMQEYVAEGAEHSSCEINAWRLAKSAPRVGGGGPRWSVEFMWSTTPPRGPGNQVSVVGALSHACPTRAEGPFPSRVR